MTTPTWPVAALDSIRRLHVLGAAVPGAVVAETTIDAPIDLVWAVAADLEHELPAYLDDVRSLRITHRDGERLRGCTPTVTPACAPASTSCCGRGGA